MAEYDPVTRRRCLLGVAGTVAALSLSGCSGDGDDGGDGGATPTPTATETVPDEYRTATALNGQERDPRNLSTKDAVNYQSEPSGEKQCSNCRFYVTDKNGDGQGACAIVEGTIAPDAYCVSYSPHEEAESPQAVDVPSDASCAVCEMNVAKFGAWNAQGVHDDDTRAFFCSSGCALTYYVVPSDFAATDAPIAGLWVTDHESGSFVDASEASFVLETDSDRLDDPMRLNPVPFESRDDALAYVEDAAGLSAEDIVELPDFDREIAQEYRGRFLDG